jgi:hypothetical protein
MPSAIDLSMAEHLDPALFAAEAGFTLDRWQADTLRQVLVARKDRVLLNCSRQSGKSTLLALAGLAEAMADETTVLVVSTSLRQSQHVFSMAARMYRRLTRRPVEPEAQSALRITFEHGGRLIAMPGGDGDTIRGYTVGLLLLDEAARISDELYYAVRPMVAVSRGRIVAASTPAGSIGWWYEAWHSTEEWLRVRVPASDCPRLSPRTLAAEAAAMHPSVYAAEYECSFASMGAFAWFDLEQARTLVRPEMEEWT